MIAETTATPRLPDAYLHHWSDIYIQLGLHQRGVPLLEFLRGPWEYIAPRELDAVVHDHLAEVDDDEHLPLLPAQRAVQARLDADDLAAAELAAEADVADLPVRDGRRVEPLHHRRYSRRWHKPDFRRRQGGVS